MVLKFASTNAEKLGGHLELACLVKMWAKKSCLTEATTKGRLTCYGFMLLVIEHLNDPNLTKTPWTSDPLEHFLNWLIDKKLSGVETTGGLSVGAREPPCDFEPDNVAEKTSPTLLRKAAEKGLSKLKRGALPW